MRRRDESGRDMFLCALDMLDVYMRLSPVTVHANELASVLATVIRDTWRKFLQEGEVGGLLSANERGR